MSRLSARSIAKFLGEVLPEVEGINHKCSVSYMARQEARIVTYQFEKLNEKQWHEHEHDWEASGARDEFMEARKHVDDLWNHAEASA